MDETSQLARIAVVDDDDLVREAFKDCLESAGYAVADYRSAEEFLASSSEQEADCLILDVRLPGMNGFELQSKLAGCGSRVPVVFVTAHVTEEAHERAVRQGAAGFLKKPLPRNTLLQSVEAALSQGHQGGRPS